jgi:hypothetical protein
MRLPFVRALRQFSCHRAPPVVKNWKTFAKGLYETPGLVQWQVLVIDVASGRKCRGHLNRSESKPLK